MPVREGGREIFCSACDKGADMRAPLATLICASSKDGVPVAQRGCAGYVLVRDSVMCVWFASRPRPGRRLAAYICACVAKCFCVLGFFSADTWAVMRAPRSVMGKLFAFSHCE